MFSGEWSVYMGIIWEKPRNTEKNREALMGKKWTQCPQGRASKRPKNRISVWAGFGHTQRNDWSQSNILWMLEFHTAFATISQQKRFSLANLSGHELDLHESVAPGLPERADPLDLLGQRGGDPVKSVLADPDLGAARDLIGLVLVDEDERDPGGMEERQLAADRASGQNKVEALPRRHDSIHRRRFN